VEAGLRSGDWRMPEEHNRVIVDHISDLMFSPTEGASRHLRREGVQGAISVVGNTVVDAVLENRRRAARRGILKRLGLHSKKDYFLFTVHREENVDNLETIKRLRRVFERLSRRFHVPMIFVVHPRTRHRLSFFGQLKTLEKIEGLRLVEPVGYLDFTRLLSECRMAFTDSGGVQEEACILRVPCVTLRDSTERPETVRVRANLLAGMNPEAVTRAAERMLRRSAR
ncbi:MAG: UDP-N-acetylglucosamine 2-epimerase (non-hydrolyzing), partial [Acidobacteria bacterium]|nr:UDP-N-acetylglucosamine 2-epimerase (non-hydrolyzing) [Acidobacteriota bacterium]